MKRTPLKRTLFKSRKRTTKSADSIVQNRKAREDESGLEVEKKCFLCGKNGYSDPLDSHHIFNGIGLRKKSEKYGLKVWLCHNECHIFGRESVHRDQRIDNILKQHGQLKVMQEQGWDTERFIKEFGKNYLEDI